MCNPFFSGKAPADKKVNKAVLWFHALNHFRGKKSVTWSMEIGPFISVLRRLAVASIFLTCWPGLTALAGTPGDTSTVVLTPTADTSLFSEGELSNGGGDYLFTGLILTGAERRALLRFDLSAIPLGATIDSASLEVTVSRTISGTVSVRLHRLLNDWQEGSVDAPGQEGTGAPASAGDATWLARRLGSELWTEPGGDFDPLESARAGLRDNGRYSYSGDALAADVQAWLDQPSSNHGWLLLGNPAAGFGSAKRLNSRENPDPASRPLLTINFTAPLPPAPPVPEQIPLGGGIWLLLLLMGMVFLGRQFTAP